MPSASLLADARFDLPRTRTRSGELTPHYRWSASASAPSDLRLIYVLSSSWNEGEMEDRREWDVSESGQVPQSLACTALIIRNTTPKERTVHPILWQKSN